MKEHGIMALNKELMQHMKAFKSLTPLQRRSVDVLIRDKEIAVREEANKALLIYCGYALLKNYVDSKTFLKIIEDITNLINYGDANKIEKELLEMANVKEEIMKFLDVINKTDKKEMIEEATFKFPVVPKNTIIKCCEEWMKNNAEAIKIVGIIDNKKPEETKTKDEAKLNKTGLKVKSMVVEGENGIYKVCDAGIELTNEGMMLSFENEAALDKFVGEFKQVFAMMR
jgi:hypothetical protein